MPWLITAVAVLVAAGAVVWVVTRSGSGSGTPAPAAPTGPKTITVHGSLILSGPNSFGVDDTTCTGMGGYSDIAAGTTVVIYDAAGKQLVVAKLPAGTQADNYIGNPARECWFTYDIPGVPAGVGPYSIEVSHRGKVPFDQSTASHVSLSLGS